MSLVDLLFWQYRRGALLTVAAVLAMPAMVVGQAAPHPSKVLTPEQTAYQAASARWLVEYNDLRKKMQDAYGAEMARAKAGDCPQADTTLAEENCLSREMATTQANYTAVVSALRAALGLARPMMPGEKPSLEPKGAASSEAERVAELDRLEAASAGYRKLAAQAALDEFKGGSMAPVFAAEIQQKLVRSHLQELASVYDTEFSNR